MTPFQHVQICDLIRGIIRKTSPIRVLTVFETMVIKRRVQKGWLARCFKLLRSFIQVNGKCKKNWGKEFKIKIN